MIGVCNTNPYEIQNLKPDIQSKVSPCSAAMDGWGLHHEQWLSTGGRSLNGEVLLTSSA